MAKISASEAGSTKISIAEIGAMQISSDKSAPANQIWSSSQAVNVLPMHSPALNERRTD